MDIDNLIDILVDIDIWLIRIVGILVLARVIIGVVKNLENIDIPLFIDGKLNTWGLFKPFVIGSVYMGILGVLYIFVSLIGEVNKS